MQNETNDFMLRRVSYTADRDENVGCDTAGRGRDQRRKKRGKRERGAEKREREREIVKESRREAVTNK